VIGTNKTDARETVACMMEDLAGGRTLHPEQPEVAQAAALVRSRAPRVVSYADWTTIDAHERAMGERSGRPRVKLTSIADMHDLL
jgi:ferredoxin--NADP+ reductase